MGSGMAIVGDEIYAGIDKEDACEIDFGIVMKFDSMEEMSDFMDKNKWYNDN